MSVISSTSILKKERLIIVWLLIGVVMLIFQILLGAITRLTGSGLSITEWKPLLGAIPPLTEKAWQESFEKYQQIAQFKKLNSHFVLSDYKSIFFWEWFHREWARLIGLVFIIPFIVFIIKKRISRRMIVPLIILFVLGGLQGLIGWIMVKSGLNDTDVVVNHVKLAIHFISALVLLVYLQWFTMKLAVPVNQIRYGRGLRITTSILLMLLFLQMIYGAFMAGSHAALYGATWPDINGQIVPASMFSSTATTWVLINDPIVIQFIHRGLAYLIALLIIVWFYQAGKIEQKCWVRKYRGLVLLLVTVQVVLGILALLNSMYSHAIYYAVLHQFVGILLLLAVVAGAFLIRRNPSYYNHP
ncbi:COX15/CtaA family protein [Desertivirga arenae]|uniref:COX15/CtaA family protein n=1 Tax=Desertivirga arenae TaxID=2810309 RepID=UPI001F6071B2|nr:COX15/CtaA family protein [Pedobacter sp. SYSU D00823]